MSGTWRGVCAMSLVLVAGGPGGSAQVAGGATAAASTSLTGELRALAETAGVVFMGTVLSVRRVEGEGVASGVVEVRFAVEQAVRGCTAGSVYTLREWAGLWQGDDGRYRVGQRMLMLLRTPGAGGLSSPVGGRDGILPLLAGANGVTGAQSDAANGVPVDGGSAREQVDLRWIGARVRRSVVYRDGGQNPRAGVRPLPVVRGRSVVAVDAESAARSVSVAVNGQQSLLPEVQRAPADAVLAMLQAWERERAGAR